MQETGAENNWPKTLAEAVDRLMAELSDEDKNHIREAEDLYPFHFGLGMYIRNQFRLWKGNEPLLADLYARLEIPADQSDLRYWQLQHPDEAPMVIMRALQERLREG